MMTRDRRILTAYLGLCLVMLLWAGNSIVGRAVRDDIPPFTLALGRWVGASLLLFPLAARAFWAERRQVLAGWKWLVFLGLVGVAGFNGFLYTGLHNTTAANGLLLQALTPPFVLLLDRIFFGVRSRAAQLAGMALSTIGVLLVVFRADLHALRNIHFGTGDALILCGVFAWAVYTSFLRKRPAVSQQTFLLATFVIAAVAMLPFAVAEADAIRAIRWTPAVWAAFAYVALGPSLIAYYLYNVGVAVLGPARAGQLLNLMPLFGAGLAALLLAEPLYGYHFVGMALIAGGIALGTRNGGAERTQDRG